MTHIVFLSPENRDSRIQMSDLADKIYASNSTEHYYNVDIAEIPSKYDIETEGKKLASFLKSLKPEGSPANIVLVAYEDFMFVAAFALAELKLPPIGLIVVNFPIQNSELFEWQQLGFLKEYVNNSDASKGNMYLLQADIMYRPVSEYLSNKQIRAEIVRVKEVTNMAELNSQILNIIRGLIA